MRADRLIGSALLETYLGILWRRRMRANDVESKKGDNMTSLHPDTFKQIGWRRIKEAHGKMLTALTAVDELGSGILRLDVEKLVKDAIACAEEVNLKDLRPLGKQNDSTDL